MPGASLRNAVKRITHKERSQPRHRAKLGILEKKKDYQRRSKDYHSKQDRLKSMQQKAAQRNPDEFYFAMHNSQMNNGEHRSLKQGGGGDLEDVLGADAVKIMKTQDLSYVRMQKQRDAKKVERLQASLHLLDDGIASANTVDNEEEEEEKKKVTKKRKHTIFVNDETEAKEFDPVKYFGTAPELVHRAFNRPKLESMRRRAMEEIEKEEEEENENDDMAAVHEQQSSERERIQEIRAMKKHAKKVAKARKAAYSELEARIQRMKTIELAEAHLVTEKNLAGKGKKRKIRDAEGGRPAVYEWSRKRLK